MPEIQYPTNPNSDTAFVVQEDGTKNRALMTAPQDTSTLELPSNANSTKGYVTIDGKKQRVILTADIGGGSGGSVSSVNGQTGDVTLTASDVSALPTTGGTMTGAINMGSNDITFKDLANNTVKVGNGGQVKGIAVNGDIVLANGKVYSKGFGLTRESGNATYPWAKTYTKNINNGADIAVPTTGGTMARVEDLPGVMTGADGTNAGTSGLVPAPAATDNDKFLAGDGTWKTAGGGATYTAGNGISIDANNEISVADPVLVNQTTSTSGGTGKPVYILNVGKGIGLNLQDTESCIVGSTNNHPGSYGTSFGLKSGAQSGTAIHGVMIGYSQSVTATGAIQIGGYGANNPDANTFKVANANGNYEIMSADGTIPEARLADTTNAQQGQVLTLDSNLNAVWQAGGGGGSSYTAGTGIDITNNAISVQNPVAVSSTGSVATVPGVNSSSLYSIGSVHIGNRADTSSNASVSVGQDTNGGDFGVGVGQHATSSFGGISLGYNSSGSGGKFHIALSESDPDTYATVTHQYDLVNIDGTIPSARLASTTGLADGNYRLRCTITNGVPTLSWVAE